VPTTRTRTRASPAREALRRVVMMTMRRVRCAVFVALSQLGVSHPMTVDRSRSTTAVSVARPGSQPTTSKHIALPLNCD
jgi:hypothetical protein